PTGTLPLGVLSVRSRGLDEIKLQDLPSMLRISMRARSWSLISSRPRLRTLKTPSGKVPVGSKGSTTGGKQRTILIYIDPQKLEARNLSPRDVVEALRRSNLMLSPGIARFGAYEFQLDSNAMVAAVEELNEIPIKFEQNNTIYLKHIGHAWDGAATQTGLSPIDH